MWDAFLVFVDGFNDLRWQNLSVHGSSDAIRQMGGVKESSRFRRNGKMNSCCFGAIFRMQKSFVAGEHKESKKVS